MCCTVSCNHIHIATYLMTLCNWGLVLQDLRSCRAYKDCKAMIETTMDQLPMVEQLNCTAMRTR